MALRNIFELLWSGEIKKARVTDRPVVSYHSNWKQRVYPPGALVRYSSGTDMFLYVAMIETGGEPGISSDWELLSAAIVLPPKQVVDKDGLIMITSGGLNLITK